MCVGGVCVQEKTGLFCVAFVRVEDASFVRSLLFRCKAVQESLLTWVASVCVCVKLESITPVRRKYSRTKRNPVYLSCILSSLTQCVCVCARVLNHAIDILPSTGVTFCHTCQFKIVLGFLLVCVCVYARVYVCK